MKNTEDKKDQSKHEQDRKHWVEVAKKFGDDCLAIQRDSKLNDNEKLKKQIALSDEMTKNIQSDKILSDKDKEIMLKSIDSYVKDCTKVHDLINKNSSFPNLKDHQKDKK